MSKNVLILGGTGIVGKPITLKALQNGYKPYVVSLEKESLPEEVEQVIVNRSSSKFKSIIKNLNEEIDQWETVIDVLTFDEVSARETHEYFKEKTKHFITISTTLVYDRIEKSGQPISEDNLLAPPRKPGGYVDGKVRLEKFWHDITDTPWTIIRPYHVLGARSYLGCIPEQNRDPRLLDRLKIGETLKLCEGGQIEFNFVHPDDIAKTIMKVIGNQKTHNQAYNVVNPEVVIARDYYAEIADQVNGKLNIETISIERVWKESKGWEMTTFPHIYNTDKLSEHVDFIPGIPIKKGIQDAIQTPPQLDILRDDLPIHQRMNKLPRPQVPTWLAKHYQS